MTLQFRLMLRISEVLNLNFDDIEIADDLYKFHIRRSKNDQSGIGRDLYVRYKDNELNPIKFLKLYIESIPCSGAIFKSFDIHHKVIENSRISDTAIRKRYKKHFVRAGLDASLFSTHSLRKGGARYASLNGANISTIQFTGGWRSSCFLRYTSVDTETAFNDLDAIE